MVVKWHHYIVSQLAHWHWIGRLQIWSTVKNWPKSRLLIGREVRMLASHWSRGPSENFQMGYPYKPEPVPIKHFWSQMAEDWFILDHRWSSTFVSQLVVNYHSIGHQLAIHWQSIGIPLVVEGHSISNQLTSIGSPLAFNWHSSCSSVTFHWQSIGTFALDW